MTNHLLILGAIYLVGCLLCYAMLRVEHAAEQKPYTYGDRLLAIFYTAFSWFVVLIMLVKAWINSISQTGYWARPVKKPVTTLK